MQEILTLIHSAGDPALAKTVPNWTRNPWLEHVYFKDLPLESSQFRLLTTHMPQEVLAAALRTCQPKVGEGGPRAGGSSHGRPQSWLQPHGTPGCPWRPWEGAPALRLQGAGG